jgi:hypothetical protein
MAQYRQSAPSQSSAGSARTTPIASAAPRVPSATPAYMSLAEKYGMTDMLIADPSNVEERTIEQEYQAYITAPLSPPTTDILKFWEVCGFGAD